MIIILFLLLLLLPGCSAKKTEFKIQSDTGSMTFYFSDWDRDTANSWFDTLHIETDTQFIALQITYKGAQEGHVDEVVYSVMARDSVIKKTELISELSSFKNGESKSINIPIIINNNDASTADFLSDSCNNYNGNVKINIYISGSTYLTPFVYSNTITLTGLLLNKQ